MCTKKSYAVRNAFHGSITPVPISMQHSTATVLSRFAAVVASSSGIFCDSVLEEDERKKKRGGQEVHSFDFK